MIAHIRHEHTDYDDRLDKARRQRDCEDYEGYGRYEAKQMRRNEAEIDRQIARNAVANTVQQIASQWEPIEVLRCHETTAPTEPLPAAAVKDCAAAYASRMTP